MIADPALQPRIVPGAPPPVPLSRSQLKRRRKAQKKDGDQDEGPASVVVTPAPSAHQALEPEEAREGTLALETTPLPEAASPLPEEESILKNSPIVELVNKRLKVTTKKIVRALRFIFRVDT
jgi:hypothetical protein